MFNRGNNREDIFIEDSNYSYFLKLLKKHVLPIADIYAYCLLKNHFHLMIRVKEEPLTSPKQNFSNFFNAYAKAINMRYNRTGKLFSERFKKKKISDGSYFTEVVYYLHANPQRHSVIPDFRNYKYSSYQSVLSDKHTDLKKTEILDWFGGRSMFKKYHDDKYLSMKESSFFGDFEYE